MQILKADCSRLFDPIKRFKFNERLVRNLSVDISSKLKKEVENENNFPITFEGKLIDEFYLNSFSVTNNENIGKSVSFGENNSNQSFNSSLTVKSKLDDSSDTFSFQHFCTPSHTTPSVESLQSVEILNKSVQTEEDCNRSLDFSTLYDSSYFQSSFNSFKTEEQNSFRSISCDNQNNFDYSFHDVNSYGSLTSLSSLDSNQEAEYDLENNISLLKDTNNIFNSTPVKNNRRKNNDRKNVTPNKWVVNTSTKFPDVSLENSLMFDPMSLARSKNRFDYNQRPDFSFNYSLTSFDYEFFSDCALMYSAPPEENVQSFEKINTSVENEQDLNVSEINLSFNQNKFPSFKFVDQNIEVAVDENLKLSFETEKTETTDNLRMPKFRSLFRRLKNRLSKFLFN